MKTRKNDQQATNINDTWAQLEICIIASLDWYGPHLLLVYFFYCYFIYKLLFIRFDFYRFYFFHSNGVFWNAFVMLISTLW